VRKAGFEAVPLTCGDELISHLERLPTKLIILDLHVPVMDGMECLRRNSGSGPPGLGGFAATLRHPARPLPPPRPRSARRRRCACRCAALRTTIWRAAQVIPAGGT
jgi:hypothetical protein